MTRSVSRFLFQKELLMYDCFVTVRVKAVPLCFPTHASCQDGGLCCLLVISHMPYLSLMLKVSL